MSYRLSDYIATLERNVTRYGFGGAPTVALVAGLTIRCHHCGERHVAELSHRAQYGNALVFAVVCPVDSLTDYYTTDALDDLPSDAQAPTRTHDASVRHVNEYGDVAAVCDECGWSEPFGHDGTAASAAVVAHNVGAL